jgi:hypothetical protein
MALTPAQGSDGLCAGERFSYPRLGAAIGVSRYTVVRALAGAEAAGWVERIEGGRGRRNAYRLTLPTAARVIHNPSSDETGTTPDPSSDETGTRLVVRRDPSRGETPIYPLRPQGLPSIVEGVRAVARKKRPDLQPDDDDLALLITHLETTHGVQNPVRYLQRCDPGDLGRLLAEAKQPNPQVSEGTSTNAPGDEADAADCSHGFPGGTGRTRAGTPRCPECRAVAQLTRSQPFAPSLDGQPPTGPADAAQRLSAPILEAVMA